MQNDKLPDYIKLELCRVGKTFNDLKMGLYTDKYNDILEDSVNFTIMEEYLKTYFPEILAEQINELGNLDIFVDINQPSTPDDQSMSKLSWKSIVIKYGIVYFLIYHNYLYIATALLTNMNSSISVSVSVVISGLTYPVIRNSWNLS